MTTVNNLTISPLRTITLQPCPGTIGPIRLAPKASADCLDYTLDFSTILQGTGDTLASIQSATITTATGTAYDLKVMWSAVAGTMAVAFLASGEPGTVQKLLFEIETVQGRVYSVLTLVQITNITDATEPPSNFPPDVLTNGKVLIAGVEALPSGYSSNGRVVMATEADAPVGTPSFQGVTSESYSGDGSGLNVTTTTKTQTIAEWIAALSSGGAQGVGIKAINVTQGAVTAGQPSTVTLTATLTDGTTTAPVTFEAPAGADGAKGDTGVAGANGTDGAAGASLKSITATQGTVTAGEASTVTLEATLTDGTTASAGTFSAPAGAVGARGPQGETGATGATGPQGATGAAGSDADVTATNIGTALGYTPADPSKFLAITPTALASLQTITAPETAEGGSNGYAFQVADSGGDTLQLGVVNEYGVRFFGVKSTDGTPGLMLTDDSGNLAYLAQHTSVDYSTEIYAGNFAVDTGYGSGGFRIIDKDSGNFQWQIWAENTATAPSPLYISAGTTDGTAWQTPALSISPSTNTATFLLEPVTSTTYTYATLPTAPADWQRALVTDKAIGSGTKGVMAMWNPTAKAWTGLGGEALV